MTILPIRENVRKHTLRIDEDRVQPKATTDFKNLFMYRYDPIHVSIRRSREGESMRSGLLGAHARPDPVRLGEYRSTRATHEYVCS